MRALLAPVPDGTGAPPRYARAMLYDYRQADPAERARGIWWTRRPAGLYYPAVRLERDATGRARLVAVEGIAGGPR